MKKITFGTELQQEFGPLFRAFKENSERIISSRPRLVFSGMLLFMCTSGLYVFLFLKAGGRPAENKSPSLAVKRYSGESVGEAYAKLKSALKLQSRLRVLLSKASLNHSDSLELGALLNEIQKIQQDKIPK